MTKVLEIKRAGYVWHIDAHAIADNRSKFYENDTSYQEEYDYVMSDEGSSEIIDWYFNNMYWSDIPEPNKRLIYSPPAPNSPEDVQYESGDDGYDVIDV